MREESLPRILPQALRAWPRPLQARLPGFALLAIDVEGHSAPAARSRAALRRLGEAGSASAYLPLAAALGLGASLRIALALAYSPGILHNPDSARYLRFAHDHPGLFSDPFAPSGYSLFLRLARVVSPYLDFTIALQHVLGLATAVLLFLAVRRVGGSRWLGLVPAAIVLLSGDQLYVEHAVLAEPLFTFLVAGALYAAVRGLDEHRRHAWLVVAGGLLAAASLVRGVGLFLLPLLALWLLLAGGDRLRQGLGAATAATAPAAIVLGTYLALAAGQGGLTGFTEQSGWNLYARAAPFADCGKFEPPPGTRALCETTAPAERPGGSFYLWTDESPARRIFTRPPRGDETVGAFARTAIAAQPLSYLSAVSDDMLRFLDPQGRPGRVLSGGTRGTISIARRDPAAEREVAATVNRFYAPAELRVAGAVPWLAAYQDVAWSGGPLLGVFALLGAFGVIAARGRARSALLLFGASGLLLLVVPAATLQYTARFGIPAAGLFAAAGALGARALAAALLQGGRRSRAVGSTGPAPGTVQAHGAPPQGAFASPDGDRARSGATLEG